MPVGQQVREAGIAVESSRLYARPVLVTEFGLHTSRIYAVSADRKRRWAVTASLDKTVRVWAVADGILLRTIRLPSGPENVGRPYAVALSPDGALVAVGGWTKHIYMFDRETGEMVHRIRGLPRAVFNLVFSGDGGRLAAVLAGCGLRVYAAELSWEQVAYDEDYSNSDSYGVTFAPDQRLATTTVAGKVRLYANDLTGFTRPVKTYSIGARASGIAFSPDGERLAVAIEDGWSVRLLDSHTLTGLKAPNPDLESKNQANLIAWSPDGETLFAGGIRGNIRRDNVVYAWNEKGQGSRRELPASQNSISSLAPLPDGGLLIAAQDPWLGRIKPDGTVLWSHGPQLADFRGQDASLLVTNDGTQVGFGFELLSEATARFNVLERRLEPSPAVDSHMAPPRQNDLPIANWRGSTFLLYKDWPLSMDFGDRCRSLAISPSNEFFVLGTDFMRFGAKRDKKICRRSGGEPEFMEDATHGRLDGIVVEIDRFWVVCAAREAEWLSGSEQGFDGFVAQDE
jgi:WD40 repeat protein